MMRVRHLHLSLLVPLAAADNCEDRVNSNTYVCDVAIDGKVIEADLGFFQDNGDFSATFSSEDTPLNFFVFVQCTCGAKKLHPKHSHVGTGESDGTVICAGTTDFGTFSFKGRVRRNGSEIHRAEGAADIMLDGYNGEEIFFENFVLSCDKVEEH